MENKHNYWVKRAVFILIVFSFLSPLYGQERRAPININLIIDGSSSLTGVKTEVSAWIAGRLDQILVDGDIVTIWSAGPSAGIIYTGTINGSDDIESAKRSIRDLSGAGNSADFSGALRQAAGSRTGSAFTYTLLISASQDSLSSTISGPQGNLLQYSRVEEFSGWRAIVIGLDLDARVRRAAASYFGN